MGIDLLLMFEGVKRMEDWYEVGSTIHFGAMLGTGISEEYKVCLLDWLDALEIFSAFSSTFLRS